MQVRREDWRPPTLLRPAPPTRAAFLGGLISSLGVHVGVPLGAMFIAQLLASWGLMKEKQEPFEERTIVEARFVKLGKELDPRKLPNREVPRLTTAPPDQVAVSKNPQDHLIPDAGKPPPNATPDAVRRLGDRAQIFAEIAEQYDREGRPEGLEDGTEKQARAGDLWAAQVYKMFRQGWIVPTTISDDERRGLVTDVDLRIGDDLRIRDYRVRKPSGNALFDQSVVNRIEELKREGVALPDPPEDMAAVYKGKALGLRFRGRDAG